MMKVAYRNLREHKSKTLIIGIIIAMGITVLIVGNSVLDTASAGIKKNYINNYTGNIIIWAKTDEEITLFGAANMTDLNAITPRIPRYQDIALKVENIQGIETANPQITGRAVVTSENTGRNFLQFFGIDPAQYKEMFPANLEIIEGDFIGEDETGIMLSKDIHSLLEESFGRKISSGDNILLTGMNPTSGTKIREVTVRGIFAFKESNPQLDQISLVDLTTARILNGMTVGGMEKTERSEIEQDFMDGVSEETLFSGNSGPGNDTSGSAIESTGKKSITEDALLDILGDTSEREKLSTTDSMAYHFLLLKTDDSVSPKRVMSNLNTYFTVQEIEAEAVEWIAAAGIAAEMTESIQVVFNIIIIIIAVVAVIIIMNTLVISITERVGEIGTMRAIGATRGEVRKMILWETLLISFIFGTIGIAAGGIILLVLSLMGIEVQNEFFRIIFGGSVIKPVISIQAVMTALITVLGIGTISSLYPVSLALKIKPVTAMQKD